MMITRETLVEFVISILLIGVTIFALLRIAYTSEYNKGVYDLWNTVSEFEETRALRKFLVGSNYASEEVSVAELDYILVLVQQCSRGFFTNVPVSLALSVISIESGFRTNLTGLNDDTGLMQIIPKYHRDRIDSYIYNERADLYDPRLNIMVGLDYLSELINQFEGDIYTALMAYNMGPTRAKEYRDNDQTSSYADIVMERMEEIEEFMDGR